MLNTFNFCVVGTDTDVKNMYDFKYIEESNFLCFVCHVFNLLMLPQVSFLRSISKDGGMS